MLFTGLPPRRFLSSAAAPSDPPMKQIYTREKHSQVVTVHSVARRDSFMADRPQPPTQNSENTASACRINPLFL